MEKNWTWQTLEIRENVISPKKCYHLEKTPGKFVKASPYPWKYLLTFKHDLHAQYKKRINKYACIYIKKNLVRIWEYLSSEAHRKTS